MKQFEDLTIAQLKKLYEQFKEQNPNFQTAEELLEEMVDGSNVKVPEQEFDYEHK